MLSGARCLVTSVLSLVPTRWKERNHFLMFFDLHMQTEAMWLHMCEHILINKLINYVFTLQIKMFFKILRRKVPPAAS